MFYEANSKGRIGLIPVFYTPKMVANISNLSERR